MCMQFILTNKTKEYAENISLLCLLGVEMQIVAMNILRITEQIIHEELNTSIYGQTFCQLEDVSNIIGRKEKESVLP